MDRFERQRRFFGSEGQDRLRAIRVGIVGVGGLGAHVAQQLAYLGVGSLILIDRDTLQQTNRNRLIGAWADDPNCTPKVDIARRLIRSIDPDIDVEVYQRDFRNDAAKAGLSRADWVFGCVDNDGARLLLTDACAKGGQAYVDLATEIRAEDGGLNYGGRVCVTTDDRGCPYCFDLLSQDDITRSLADGAERRDLAAIYGVPVNALCGSGPSVVYLNGIIASIGVAEFAAAITELRAPARVLEYRGEMGIVIKAVDPPEAGCPYCALRSGGM